MYIHIYIYIYIFSAAAAYIFGGSRAYSPTAAYIRQPPKYSAAAEYVPLPPNISSIFGKYIRLLPHTVSGRHIFDGNPIYSAGTACMRRPPNNRGNRRTYSAAATYILWPPHI